MHYTKFLKPLKIYALLFAMLLLACGADEVIESAKNAMRVCFSAVIPSLFPFMVLSGMFVSSVTPRSFKKIGLITNALFGIRAPANAAFIPGIVCGYPIGARCACELYTSGIVSKSEAESLIAYSNNSGPLFVIGAVGAGMLGSARLGMILYILQILCALFAAFVLKYFTEYPALEGKYTKKFQKDFAANICSGVGGVLNVCGFIVFFAAINALISPALNNLPPFVRSIVCSLLEVTNAIKQITLHGFGLPVRAALISFSLGWSGLSVHMQVKSIVAPAGLSMKKYYITRFMIGIFSAVLTYFFIGTTDSVLLALCNNKGVVFAGLFAFFSFAILCTKKGTRKKSLLNVNPEYIR